MNVIWILFKLYASVSKTGDFHLGGQNNVWNDK